MLFCFGSFSDGYLGFRSESLVKLVPLEKCNIGCFAGLVGFLAVPFILAVCIVVCALSPIRAFHVVPVLLC